jgi:hypothetical protein
MKSKQQGFSLMALLIVLNSAGPVTSGYTIAYLATGSTPFSGYTGDSLLS